MAVETVQRKTNDKDSKAFKVFLEICRLGLKKRYTSGTFAQRCAISNIWANIKALKKTL